MKKLIAKMRKIKMTRWNKLTLGEKIMKVVISLIKLAAIVAVVVALAGVFIAVAIGVAVAFGIASAVSGGFINASRAYNPGDRYVKFR